MLYTQFECHMYTAYNLVQECLLRLGYSKSSIKACTKFKTRWFTESSSGTAAYVVDAHPCKMPVCTA